MSSQIDYQKFLSGSHKQSIEFLRNEGYLCLINHPLDIDLLKKSYSILNNFFNLPTESKQKYLNLPNNFHPRGYMEFGNINEYKKMTLDDPSYKEAWHMGPEVNSLNPVDQNIWPTELREFKPTLIKIYKSLFSISSKVLNTCALHLGLESGYFDQYLVDPNSLFRVLKYPKIKSSDQNMKIRTTAHSDVSLLTLVCGPDLKGLEFIKNNKWTTVNAPSHSLVITTGDILEFLTKKHFKSQIHRVVSNEKNSEERLSMPFFLMPRESLYLNPLFSKDHPNHSTTNLTVGEFIKNKLAQLPRY